MERLEAEHAVLYAHDSATGAGRTRLQPPLNFSGGIKLFRARKRRTLSMRGGGLGEASGGENLGVWTVSTLWVTDWAVPVPDWTGFLMFGRESSVCRGLNPVRVPPRAQCFRMSEGFLVFFRVHIVHTLASDLMLRVWGPGRPIWLCGEWVDYGRTGTALWGLFWVFILVRPFRWVYAFTTSLRPGPRTT